MIEGTAAERRQSIARGASPWTATTAADDSPAGAAETPSQAHCRPYGASDRVRACSQGLTPLAIHCRPCGANVNLPGSRRFIGSLFFCILRGPKLPQIGKSKTVMLYNSLDYNARKGRP